jgi:cation transport ATPase
LAQSRKRRKERQRAAAQVPAEPAASPAPAEPADAPERGYARSRAKNEAARAALRPLAPGERPTAVTVGAIVAALLGLANLIAVVAGWNGAAGEDDRARALAGSILVAGLLFAVAWGMWHARYWAVLGMQTLLALTLIASALGLVTASSAWGAVLLVLILAAAGTLFWFMVKAMARIQMPERPTRTR